MQKTILTNGQIKRKRGNNFMNEFDPKNNTGRPMPRMAIVIPLMKGTIVDQQEGYKTLLKEATVFEAEDGKTFAIVQKIRKVDEETGEVKYVTGRKATAKVTKGDTPDRETGLYVAFAKYLTNWKTSRLETYIKRRVPKLERTSFAQFKTAIELALTDVPEKYRNSVLKKIKKQENVLRQRIEKEVVLEIICKLSGYDKSYFDAYLTRTAKKTVEPSKVEEPKTETTGTTNTEGIKLNPEFVEFFGQMLDAYNKSKNTTSK